jgi:glycosyltransferase involved in cell wall biosynthesis
MKLLILSDAPIYRVEGEYYSQDTFPKFIGGLNKYFSAITMLSPVYDGRNGANLLYKLPCNDKGPIILGTSPVASVTEYYRRIIKILVYNIPIFCKALKESDAILTRSPAMNTFIFALLAIMYRKPVFCYFIGDEKSVIKSGTKYKGIKYYLALVISNIHNLLYRIIFSFAKASFFLSEDLRKKYVKNKDNSYFMFTSLIDDSDIEKKTEIGEIGLNPTILSVGRLSPEKGIQYLIRAMPIMSRQNIQARLLICGSGPSEEEYQARVKEL